MTGQDSGEIYETLHLCLHPGQIFILSFISFRPFIIFLWTEKCDTCTQLPIFQLDAKIIVRVEGKSRRCSSEEFGIYE